MDGEALGRPIASGDRDGFVNKVSLPYEHHSSGSGVTPQRQFRSYQWLYDPSTGIEAYNSVAYNNVVFHESEACPQCRFPDGWSVP